VIKNGLFDYLTVREVYVFRKLSMTFDKNKAENYIKGVITSDLYNTISDIEMALLYKGGKGAEMLMCRNSLNKYVGEKFYRKKTSYFSIPDFILLQSIGYFILQIGKRGLSRVGERKSYKLAKEATWGLNRKYFRDDLLIGNNFFEKNDFLLTKENSFVASRNWAFQHAENSVYSTFDLTTEPYPITYKSSLWLYKMTIGMLWTFFVSMFKRESNFFEYYYYFYKSVFHLIILMENFDIKFYQSVKDHNYGNAESMLLNTYGCKNFIIHWTDYSIFPYPIRYFVSHDIFFLWGKIMLQYINQNSESKNVTKFVPIGCPGIKLNSNTCSNHSLESRKRLLKMPDNKTVSFFGTSINDNEIYSGFDMLEYMENIYQFALKNPRLNVILKHKSFSNDSIPQMLERSDYKVGYKKISKKLMPLKNFTNIDSRYYFSTDIIEISDVVIMWSTATIPMLALLGGVNALCYEVVKNESHPLFADYKNVIIFSEWSELVNQIQKMINDEISCKEIVSQEFLTGYDTYRDNNTLNRVGDYLYNSMDRLRV